jgi:hypothetical protein
MRNDLAIVARSFRLVALMAGVKLAYIKARAEQKEVGTRLFLSLLK